mgnify:CR=1 FL=1
MTVHTDQRRPEQQRTRRTETSKSERHALLAQEEQVIRESADNRAIGDGEKRNQQKIINKRQTANTNIPNLLGTEFYIHNSDTHTYNTHTHTTHTDTYNHQTLSTIPHVPHSYAALPLPKNTHSLLHHTLYRHSHSFTYLKSPPTINTHYSTLHYRYHNHITNPS